MLNKTQRLAIAMVICWIGLGVGSRARADSIALQTPPGLSPGDHFRFVFVTDGSTTGTSSNIADYDSFVDDPGGRGYIQRHDDHVGRDCIDAHGQRDRQCRTNPGPSRLGGRHAT